MMNIKQKYLTTISIFALLFLTSCLPPHTEINMDINAVAASENILAPQTTAIQPEIGRHTLPQGTLVKLNAQDTNTHKFIKWTISPNYVPENTYNVFSNEYVFNLVRNKEVLAHYGCKTNDACEEGYTCTQTYLCIQE